MQWDDETRIGVDIALNESEVLGLRLEPSGGWCDLLLHVLALPENGPIDPDARRILRLTTPSQVKILLRAERMAGHGDVIPLDGLDAVEEFFASIRWSGAIYGWKFLDDPSLTRDWPAETSLTIDLRSSAASHSLYWFNECGRGEGELNVTYCVEGTVAFESLEVLRADATPQPLHQFISEGQNFWRALRERDERVSGEGQRAARSGTPSWRQNVRS